MLWLYNVHLQISPRERRIAIVEKSSESENFRERVAVAALKFIAAPGLIFITRPVASVTGCGIASNTGLVVNLGKCPVGILVRKNQVDFFFKQ